MAHEQIFKNKNTFAKGENKFDTVLYTLISMAYMHIKVSARYISVMFTEVKVLSMPIYSLFL